MGPDMVKISRPMGMVPRMFLDCDMALAPFFCRDKRARAQAGPRFPEKIFKRTVLSIASREKKVKKAPRPLQTERAGVFGKLSCCMWQWAQSPEQTPVLQSLPVMDAVRDESCGSPGPSSTRTTPTTTMFGQVFAGRSK